jgi:hypothetical protein
MGIMSKFNIPTQSALTVDPIATPERPARLAGRRAKTIAVVGSVLGVVAILAMRNP